MPFPSDLFATIVDESRLHRQFRDLRDQPDYAAARALMNDLYSRMGDPNGNFIAGFQGRGFHSRLFELACFAYLESANLKIDRSFEQPDFLASRDGVMIAVESVTANPPHDQGLDIAIDQMAKLPDREILEKVSYEFPKRIVAILRKKLSKRYHHAPHVSGRPLIFMVAPNFEAGSAFYTDDALLYSLYGPPESDPIWQGRPAFFWNKQAASISAVLYCNAFSVSRFFRLALREDSTITAIRSGVCYRQHSSSDLAACQFEYEVGDPAAPRETWGEGVTLFHNPFASHPLPERFLPASSTISIQDGYVYREVLGFHPLVSYMIAHVPRDTDTHP